VRTAKSTRSEGVVLLRGGNPEASVHQRAGVRLKGRAALKQVWQDSYDDGCAIELHARVDMDGLLREYADAVLERPAKVMRKPKVPQPVNPAEVERDARRWKEAGYDVSSVESALGGDPVVLTIAFLSLKEAIKKAEAVEETLLGLDVSGFEARAATIRENLRNPVAHPDIDADVESLRDAIESRRQVDARRETEAARERDSAERTRKVVQLVMKQKALSEEPPTSREEVAKALETPPPVADEATHLIKQYTFDSFVIGPSNHFAQAAAHAVALGKEKGYNPLLITSGPGLGKTHLLHAVGNGILRRRKDSKVLYLSGESFANEFKAAQENGSLAAFRAKVRGVDGLLLDDVQFLSGRSDVQEELFHAFNDLYNAEKQIVMASDRAPKAIPDLDERLVSRFESGLVADIRPPEKETRIAILELRARDGNLEVAPAVLEVIADLVEDNVRELGGAFNRVVAFSSLMGRPITEELAKEVLRDAGTPAPAPAPAEKLRPEDAARDLSPGRSYLVEEDRPIAAFRLYAKALQTSHRGMVITRTNPRRVREAHDLEADRMLWLTDREGSSEDTIQPVLERIVYEIDEFFSKRPGGALMLDGLEYLVSNNSFEAVLKFVRRVVDSVSEGHSILILSLGPATLKEQEVKMLEREMEVLRFG
jgi:chromosomal replication initiator protein DnaA